jgi:ElaB/YqjD/DUF883 family membrane-anchored ribosome-binding protein
MSELTAAHKEKLMTDLRTVISDTTVARAKAAGHAADDYVHDHPWKAIGAAAGIGMIIGLLIGRR